MELGKETREVKVHVDNLTKRFGDLLVLDQISFDVYKGELLCVVGPTGCGKTTFLNCLTHIYDLTAGQILMDGKPVNAKTSNIAYIFQGDSTMPWLTVAQNVAFGLNIKHTPPKQRDELVDKYLDIVGLTKFRNYYPKQLSSSMLQRVSIARAFATEPELLTLAAALESRSEHPLAKAVLADAEAKAITSPEVTDFAALPGNGLAAKLDGMDIYAGNAAFIQTKLTLPAALAQQAEKLAAEGKTPLFFGGTGRLLGVIAVADTIKEDSPEAIRQLQNMGIRVVMLTGDNQHTADAIGRQAGVDEVIAGVLPDGKEAVIRQLQASGKVAMVGDGINDAPALTRADTGIAIGAGTDVAIDAADVVLMNSKLSDVPAAIRLSRATLRNIHENLFWAFIYNIIGIPLAAGLFIPFGLTLNPMFGAAAMSLSSFCVVSNALRLNLFDLHSTRHDHKTASPAAAPVQSAAENNKKSDADAPEVKTEDNTMKKTLKVEGMMCGHCEARVKKALEALPEVDEAVVSHEAGTAIVTLNAEVADDVLKNAVEAQDYKVTGIQ